MGLKPDQLTHAFIDVILEGICVIFKLEAVQFVKHQLRKYF